MQQRTAFSVGQAAAALRAPVLEAPDVARADLHDAEARRRSSTPLTVACAGLVAAIVSALILGDAYVTGDSV